MKKKPSKRSTYANNDKLIMRMVSVRADTLSNDQSSVQVVIATENPVERFDYVRGTVVREVLAMDGVEFRTKSRQLPIVDSHDRSSVKNVLGSVRNLRTEGDELVGDAVFAADDESQVAFQKLRDGHITDFSITATPNEITFVPSGQSTVVREQTIEGPAEIVTRWRPTDASLVATGADERSTVRDSLRRSYDLATTHGEDGMSPTLIEKLQKSLGLPVELTENSEIEKWIAENVTEPTPAPTLTDPEPAPEPDPEPEPEPVPTEEPAGVLVEHALQADRDRQREIRALCHGAEIQRTVADNLCDSGASIEVARKQVLEHLMKDKPLGTPPPTVTRSAIDKAHDAVRDGLVSRSYQSSGVAAKAPEGNGDFKYTSLLRMAETILESGGVNVRRMAPRDIAMAAMGHEPTLHRSGIARDGEAYHVTGTFANLLLDAANKTLLAAYDEATFTWNMWARQASSVADFKNINRVRFSEAPDLSVVPENNDYSEGGMSDEKESYSIEKFGKIFSVTWETIVNDDLDAISRIPAMQGAAARRTQNKKVYQVLTDNAAMADGTALFHADHSNLDASGAVPSVAELNAAYTSFMTQTGLGGQIIGVVPQFLIGPPALRGTIKQLLGSFSDPAAGGSAAGNSNTINIHQGILTEIIEPQLNANSATAWYLAAAPSQIDTVELAFLQGEETPVLESEFDFNKDVWKYKIRQTFGVKAIDWRGLYKNPGA